MSILKSDGRTGLWVLSFFVFPYSIFFDPLWHDGEG